MDSLEIYIKQGEDLIRLRDDELLEIANLNLFIKNKKMLKK